jgi:hypothetical protein
MKLNFWQWLGLVVLVLGALGLYLYKKDQAEKPTAPTAPAPAMTTRAS